ncbi:IS1380 family transposase [bacterium]|nr:IS1380 family transposase [bacterium]
MVNENANRALSTTRIPERFDEAGATGNGGAGPFLDYALDVLHLGGMASILFDDLKAKNADFTGGFDVTLLVVARPLGYIRPEDFGSTARDPYLAQKLGADRLPDSSTVNRSLHRLEGEKERADLRAFHRQVLKRALSAKEPEPYVILDGDSSVEVVYGSHMEGASKGYNPRAHGRKSYHPMIFSDGVRDLVLGAWLRPGNASDHHDFLDHYRETRDFLASIGRPILFARLDRGFRGEATYATFEADDVGYAVKTTKSKGISDAVDGVDFEEITCEGDGEQIEVSEIWVMLDGWTRKRRVVVVRTRQRDLEQMHLDGWGWRYECIVTNLDWSPEDVWRFYNRRCQAENVIKELKEGYGVDKLSTGSFGANDADLVLKVISYDLVWCFRHDVLPSDWRSMTIGTLRSVLLKIPGVIRKHSRRWYIKLASWYRHQEVFEGIRDRVDALAA